MNHVDTFPHSVREYPDWGITMSDGTRLSARIWLPEDANENPVPVILEHLPYRKRDGTIVRDQFTHPWFAGHGYCCIRTDMRGNGDSEGLMTDEYTEQEWQDACEVMRWAAAQPWCNGHVGMMGISWGGFNALQLAALQPPELKAIITICSTVDRFADDIHSKGGCQLGENFGWSTNMLAYSSRPPDPALVGEERWKEMWTDRLDAMPWHWSDWMRHQRRDAYWRHGSVCENYDAIQCPVLTIGGWHDGYRNTIAHLVENLSVPVKGIVGPWNHKYPHYAGPQPAIGFLQEALRWWDHWLKGTETGVEDDPAMRLYLMDSLPPQRWFDHRPGRWIADRDWPNPAIKDHVLHCRNDGSLGNEDGALSLTHRSPQDCGEMAGEYFPFAFSDELPGDQRADDQRSLRFDGQTVDGTMDIVGAPKVDLTVKPECDSGLVAVRLCDLRPDGTSALISHGVFNLTHHRGHDQPQQLEPGEAISISFPLDQIAYRLPAGHRLRLAISTAYWPFVWPSASGGGITLQQGSITVPVRPTAEGEEWQFEEPEGAPAWRAEQLRPSSYSRVHDTLADGTTVIRIENYAGENRDLEHGLVSGSKTIEEWSIHPGNPLSARSTIRWTKTGGRDGALWKTRVEAEMWCDARRFYSTARLSCFIENELFHERHFEDAVERDHV